MLKLPKVVWYVLWDWVLSPKRLSTFCKTQTLSHFWFLFSLFRTWCTFNATSKPLKEKLNHLLSLHCNGFLCLIIHSSTLFGLFPRWDRYSLAGSTLGSTSSTCKKDINGVGNTSYTPEHVLLELATKWPSRTQHFRRWNGQYYSPFHRGWLI
jgi:hypothetical protein